MLKGSLGVTFVSQHGTLETGIDHGGLVKEFLEEVCYIMCLGFSLGSVRRFSEVIACVSGAAKKQIE